MSNFFTRLYDKWTSYGKDYDIPEDDRTEEEEGEEILREKQHRGFFRLHEKKEAKPMLTVSTTSGSRQVIMMAPKKIEEAVEVVDYVKTGNTVIVSMVSVSESDKRRIVDYVSGAIRALDGDIQKVANGVFVLGPEYIEIVNYIDVVAANKNTFSPTGK